MPRDHFEIVLDLWRSCGDDWRAAVGGATAIAGLWFTRSMWRGVKRLFTSRPVTPLCQGLLDFLARDDVAWDAEHTCADTWILHGGPTVFFRVVPFLHQVSVNARDVTSYLTSREKKQVVRRVHQRITTTRARDQARVADGALMALAGIQRTVGQPLSTKLPDLYSPRQVAKDNNCNVE